ncbi:uncharacterized protein LOC127845097 isoform X3 [Dreissena polymorpha]|uniref:uncharacterized protein LOC127845097 isoform X3 n=1 Tax=Dreissena polymorpha TaxID=45954 RepID=UPI0022650085|nr:uncharacterized protein LOC127845097 isoform X3 [Dreissena polymorpha]
MEDKPKLWNSAYDYEKYEQEGYKTPASFSTKRTLNNQAPRTAQAHAAERGPGKKGTQSLREQSRSPDDKLEESTDRDAEESTDRDADMSNDRQKEEQLYYQQQQQQSPRQQYAPRYPQEPIRRRRNEYEQPPDIGYDPYAAEQQNSKRRDASSKGGEPHPGWILLLRFHRDGIAQVKRALLMCQKHIEQDMGRIMGIALSYGVRIREGGDAWVTFGRMRHFGGGNWDVQQSPTQDETNYCVLAIYYPSLTRAIQWFDRDSMFKQKDFPTPYTTDCIALPLNSSVDTKFSKTLVLTEYPRISHPEYFRDKFSIPTEDMMRTRFRSTPYVVKATSIPIDDPRQRVARHLRGCWIKRNSIITVSMFDSMSEAHRYFTDPEYYKCKECQDRVSAPTTVIMDLEDWRNL